MQLPMFSSEELPARALASPDSERAWLIRVATSSSPILPLLHATAPAGWSGRTSPASYPIAQVVSEPSSVDWQNSGMGGPTGCLTLNSSEWPSDAGVCSLSQVARGWGSAGAVLFERAGLSWDPPPSRESRERVAPSLAARTRGGGGLGTDAELDGALIAHALRGEGFDASEDGAGRGIPLIPETVGALTDGAHNGGGLNGQDAYTGRIIAFSCKDHGADAGELSPTLRSMGHDGSHANAGGQVAIAFNARQDPDAWAERTGPLDIDGGSQATLTGLRVRRLTPRECERLQGFPDDFTLIPYRRKLAKDGPRYKALGNSMAVPVMRWIGNRIALVEEVHRLELAA